MSFPLKTRRIVLEPTQVPVHMSASMHLMSRSGFRTGWGLREMNCPAIKTLLKHTFFREDQWDLICKFSIPSFKNTPLVICSFQTWDRQISNTFFLLGPRYTFRKLILLWCVQPAWLETVVEQQENRTHMICSLWASVPQTPFWHWVGHLNSLFFTFFISFNCKLPEYFICSRWE